MSIKRYCICEGTTSTGGHTEDCIKHIINTKSKSVGYWLNQCAKAEAERDEANTKLAARAAVIERLVEAGETVMVEIAEKRRMVAEMEKAMGNIPVFNMTEGTAALKEALAAAKAEPLEALEELRALRDLYFEIKRDCEHESGGECDCEARFDRQIKITDAVMAKSHKAGVEG